MRSGTGLQAQGKTSFDQPSPTIMAGGLGGGNTSQYWIEDDGKPMSKLDTNKPPYRVPLMSEIREIPWNGFTVASTFSGAGGSCTGYRMAGFKVVWANEFVPAAQASYKANCASDSILDCRDIKLVQASEILAATGLKVGELDIFDGSPPCQAFSTAGKREKGWGKDKSYEHGAKQKNETLFDEYVRLLRGLKPKVFVAENVSGLVKGTAKGYFLEILAALKASGYRVTCRVLDAQWLGVPQQRQRTIFVGVREDLNIDPAHPTPLPYRYSVRDALPWIIKASVATHGFTKGDELTPDKPAPAVPASGGATYTGHQVEAVRDKRDAFGKEGSISNAPSPAIMAGTVGNLWMQGPTEKRKFTIDELKRICAFPDDFTLCGSYAQQWERLGNSVPPLMMRAIASTIRDRILSRIK
jgi:DNA (cytosine-5)-methyltransferase 1